MKPFYPLPFIFLFIQGLLAQQPNDFSDKNRIKQFSEFYQNILTENGMVGSTVWIIQDGDVIHQDYFGQSNREKNQPMHEEAIFHWASITKTFTGIAIMQLRDRGLLKLEDPVTKYLPELRQVYNPYGSMDDITIRHLLTHSAGFRSPTWLWRQEEWQPHSPPEWEQVEAMLPYSKIHFQPGSKWLYSNPGIVFLGRIIEILSRDDYEYYIDKNILKPLEMHRSYFDKTPLHLIGDLCQSYFISKEGEISPAMFDLNTGITVSNGGLSSSFADMTKYVRFLLGTGDQQLYEKILKRSSLEEMFVPQLVAEEEVIGADKEWQAITFFMEDIMDMKIYGHSGWQNGFNTHLYFDPAHNMAYLIAYNSTSSKNRQVDADIKLHLFKNFFLPLWKK